MTTFPWVGRVVRAALPPALIRPAQLVDEAGSLDPIADSDLLGWLGFTPGDAEDEPLLVWPRPGGWPAARTARGRHRAVRLRAA